MAGTPYSSLVYGDGTTGNPYRTSVTLRAVYTEKSSYTVNFDWNYDGVPGGTDPVDTQTGVLWTLAGFTPHTITRSGWTLQGWSLTADGLGALVLPDTQYKTLVNNVDSQMSVTLYAKWERAAFVVQYDLNGMAMPGGWVNTVCPSSSSPLSCTVAFDDTNLIPNGSALNRVGYELSGWKVSVNGATARDIVDIDGFRTSLKLGRHTSRCKPSGSPRPTW